MKFYLQNIEDFAPQHLLYCFFRLEKRMVMIKLE